MNDDQAVETPPLTLHSAAAVRADERRRVIAFLSREARRCGSAAAQADGVEAEVLTAHSASVATAASLLTAWAGGYAADLEPESTSIEVAQARTNERQRIAGIVRGKADELQLPASKRVAFQIADLIGSLGP